MASTFYADSTKKFNIPLSHLEFSYINSCTNVKELEKIVYVLRSGSEGKYPELEACAEKRLQQLDPKSRLLRKETPILRPGDLSSGDWKEIENDLQNWAHSMKKRDIINGKKESLDNVNIADENIPPVRGNNIVLEGKKQKQKPDGKKKRVTPKDYKEWDKLDINAEIEKIDNEGKQMFSTKPSVKSISEDIDVLGLTKEEKEKKANREKDKGNEAFHSKDFKESVVYYTRSIKLLPTAASYNNRALAYLKLEDWDKAIADCNSVLNLEESNIKALLRRATGYKNQQKYREALIDLEQVLGIESNNKIAKDLFESINSIVGKEKSKKGKRMIIEEVDDTEELTLADKTAEVVQEKNLTEENKSTDLLDHLHKIQSQTLPEAVKLSSCKDDESPSLQSSDSIDACALNNPNISPEVPLLNHQSDLAIKDKSSTALISRPQYVQYALPSDVEQYKKNGNDLFRSGQYGHALDEYAKAITKLEKDCNQQVNLSILLNNRAACHLKVGHCIQTVDDCTRSLNLVPHNVKALTRRASAYETLEKYSEAYVDYKHAISVEAMEQAYQGAHRCQSILQSLHGKHWREKIPPMTSVLPWEIPVIIDQSQEHPSSATSFLNSHPAKCSINKVPFIKEQIELSTQNKDLPSEQIDSSANVVQSSVATEQQKEILMNSDHPSAEQTKSKDRVLPVEKLKDPPINNVMCSMEPKESSINNVLTSAEVQTMNTNTEPKPDLNHVQLIKEEEFEKLKQLGNDLVQKSQFDEAVKHYTSCILLCPEQTACYTNRALCYLKLNKPSEAIVDCSMALSLKSDNSKALYRRALAYKMMCQYKSSLQDLVELLKLEPKNCAAQKEMDAVKMLFKQELEKLKAVKQTEQETKMRKKVKIEEVDEEEEPKLAKEKSKSQAKARNMKNLQQTASKTKVEKKQSTVLSDNKQPPAPPIASRLMKTTPYEFCQAWNSLRLSQGIQPYTEILRQVLPADLPSVISNKLDGQMLQTIVRCVHEEMLPKGEMDLGFQILDNLCKVPRFSTVSMFMSSKEKKVASLVLDTLAKSTSALYSTADIVRLKKEYSVK